MEIRREKTLGGVTKRTFYCRRISSTKGGRRGTPSARRTVDEVRLLPEHSGPGEACTATLLRREAQKVRSGDSRVLLLLLKFGCELKLGIPVSCISDESENRASSIRADPTLVLEVHGAAARGIDG